MMLKRMSRLKWNILAIPSAKPNIMQTTPSLDQLLEWCGSVSSAQAVAPLLEKHVERTIVRRLRSFATGTLLRVS